MMLSLIRWGALLGYMVYLIWIRIIEDFNLMKVLKKGLDPSYKTNHQSSQCSVWNDGDYSLFSISGWIL